MQLSDYDYNKYNSWSDLYDKLMLAGYYDYDAYVDELVGVIHACSLRTCLEIGVGTGLVASKLAVRANIEILGIDFSERMIEVCKRNFPEIETDIGDITDYEFHDIYDLVFSVGGPWYYMQRGEELMFCSHLPVVNLQTQSINNVCRSMRPGSVLALAIQGPHVDLSREINENLTFSQKIRVTDAVGEVFEKDYIFQDNGKIISKQTCLFRLSGKSQIETQLSQEGLVQMPFGSGQKFVFYRKR